MTNNLTVTLDAELLERARTLLAVELTEAEQRLHTCQQLLLQATRAGHHVAEFNSYCAHHAANVAGRRRDLDAFTAALDPARP